MYTKFIPQNVALSGVRRIGIYDSNGNRVGQIPLGSLTPPTIGQKKYSIGVMSDVHVNFWTGAEVFRNALDYFKNYNPVDMICIAGDLATNGTDADLSQYKTIVDECAPDIPIYVSAGNHDCYDASNNPMGEELTSAAMLKYTGNPLYYSFEYGDDVYIFVGICTKAPFTVAEMQWLYETLERYRNKRCFLFQHTFLDISCGRAFGNYPPFVNDSKIESIFKGLLSHYHNIIWFHGHSHTKFHGQELGQIAGRAANYDNVFGCHSVHIPSLTHPKTDVDLDGSVEAVEVDSECYVVDVYENGIHLRGISSNDHYKGILNGKFLPIASYWLDTTLQEIPANSYTGPLPE